MKNYSATMEEWITTKLSEIGTIVGGATPSTKNPANYDGNIAWITPKDMTTLQGRFISKGERSITEAGYNSCSCKMMPKGSILFSSRAPIGYVAISANDLCTNQGFKSLVPNPEILDGNFAYYLLVHNKKKIERLGSGTTFLEVSGKVMANVEISLPPLHLQRRISSILSSLDDKIECNQKICKNLEAQAQALFKHWFVDFAPFKDGKFIDSDLGMIPEGWRVGTLGEIAEFKRGKTITKVNVKKGIIPVVAGGLEPAYYHNESNTSSRVITISGSGANAGFCRMYYTSVWASDCSFVDSKSTNSLHTAYCYLLVNKTKVKALQWGAAQPHVYAKDINKLPLAIAPNNILTEFENIVSKFFDRMEICDKESSRLATLRDTLLPKLMSGQIKLDSHEEIL